MKRATTQDRCNKGERANRANRPKAGKRARTTEPRLANERAIPPDPRSVSERSLDDDTPLDIRLTEDLRESAKRLTESQARYLVDTYYQIQHFRIAAAGMTRASNEVGEPVTWPDWFADRMRKMEGTIKSALNVYTDEHRPARWAKSQYGIGPVIAAGLLAHVDIKKCPSPSALWRYAGLDPTSKWNKGEKRPWNAKLKVLTAFKMGESFVKVCNKPDALYGRLYADEKKELQEANEQGKFAEAAAGYLKAKRFGTDTFAFKAYTAGKLPDAHIHARARRFAVKIFLSHYWEVLHECAYGTKPAKPYVFTILGHSHYIPPPNWPMRES